MPKTILAVVAHPDDELIGLAGTLAVHAAKGDNVHILILADGETSRSSDDDLTQNIIGRESVSTRVSNMIGARSVTCLSMPDNQLDTVPRLELAKIIEKKIDVVKASCVYTHHRWDVNIDHQRAHEAVVIATRPMPGQNVKTLMFFETASSTEWSPPQSGFAFQPNVFVDISGVWGEKIAALKLYDSEMRKFPHARSYEAIEALAKWRGASAGVEMAEAFMLGRHIN